MRRSIWLKGVLIFGLAVALASAQETEPRKEPRGRLPTYWNEVVEPEQKEALYEIQKKYEAQIEDLEKQMAALEKQREAEMLSLLSQDQKEKLARVRAFWENEQALKKEKEAKAQAEAEAAAKAAAIEAQKTDASATPKP